MEKIIKVIGGRRYRLTPEEAGLVELVRKIYRLKFQLDELKKEFEEQKQTLISIARRKRGRGKSATFDGIDMKIRVEFPETHAWAQAKLEEVAREYGAVFFEFFQSSVSYNPRPKLNLLLDGKVSQGYQALAAAIRAAKTIKQGKPRLRLEKAE